MHSTPNPRSLIFPAVLVGLTFALPYTWAYADDNDGSSSLPSGYYIYLGANPGQTPPRGLRVDSSGKFRWQLSDTIGENAGSEKQAGRASTDDAGYGGAIAPKPANTMPGATPDFVPDSVETLNYPYIKWKPKPLAGHPGVYVQLETTFDGSKFPTKVRYKLTAVNAGAAPSAVTVKLLDQQGFVLSEAGTAEFNVIPGTTLYRSEGEFYCKESDYTRFRNYTVR